MVDIILTETDMSSRERIERQFSNLQNPLDQIENMLGFATALSFRLDTVPDVWGNNTPGLRLFLSFPNRLDSANAIRLFGFYYGMDTGYFYLNDPMKSQGIPVLSMRSLLGSVGAVMPGNINDIIARYKLTGKIHDFIKDLRTSEAELSGTYLRFLLSSKVPVGSLDDQQIISKIFNPIAILFGLVKELRRMEELVIRVQLKNLTATLPKNLDVDFWDLRKSSSSESDSERVMLQAYYLSTPEDPYKATRGVVSKSSFSQMKAINSYEILVSEGRSSELYPYFDFIDVDLEESRYLQLVDGRERSAAKKSVEKHLRGSIDSLRMGSAPLAVNTGSVDNRWKLLEKVFTVVRPVARRLSKI